MAEKKNKYYVVKTTGSLADVKAALRGSGAKVGGIHINASSAVAGVAKSGKVAGGIEDWASCVACTSNAGLKR